jgi:hypothetical protein
VKRPFVDCRFGLIGGEAYWSRLCGGQKSIWRIDSKARLIGPVARSGRWVVAVGGVAI